jgi:hypothetical protein
MIDLSVEARGVSCMIRQERIASTTVVNDDVLVEAREANVI